MKFSQILYFLTDHSLCALIYQLIASHQSHIEFIQISLLLFVVLLMAGHTDDQREKTGNFSSFFFIQLLASTSARRFVGVPETSHGLLKSLSLYENG